MSRTRRRLLRTVGVGMVTGVTGCLGGGSSSAEQARSHRDALSKYTDVGRALQDGYQMTTPYVRTDDGMLGLPFVNLDVPELEPEQPSVLFYDLRDDGTYELLGVEWLVRAGSRDSPPSMFGKEFHGPTPGETEFIPEHYGLHAWLFNENPDGLFAPYHSGVNPPSFIDDLERAWEALTPYYSNEAKAEEVGYVNTEKCIATEDGGYGIPFVNTDYAGTELVKPAVLMYRITQTWGYGVMGAEWYVPADSTDSPPSLFGQEFYGPIDGHSPKSEQPKHYGLHVWMFAANPEGMFARYNPAIEC